MRALYLAMGTPALAAAFSLPALAQHRGHHAQRHLRVEPWHGDIRRFHRDDFSVWRGGRWYHGLHGGRDGWWWIVGLNWYLYPGPVYPYPNPYFPPPAVALAPPVSDAAPPYWYYCANPAGYYPYVPRCFGRWQRVPAIPQ